jgi:serine O-acetyltransferase
VNATNDTGDDGAARREFRRQIRSRHPRLLAAVAADARVTAAHRGERSEFSSRIDAALQVLRLIWVTDAFAAQALYRAKARMQALRVPILPRIAHRLAMTVAQVSIGDSVVVAAGVYIVHGQVVIDGITEIDTQVVISPFVTVGLRAGNLKGPTIESNVNIGTGAKLIGPIRVRTGAKIGANAVVVDDVPPGSTAVGSPARPTDARLEAAS